MHLRIDDFMGFVATSRVEPWRPAAERQNRVLGGAVAAAALQFAAGGYSVVVDGHIFPEALDELAPWCEARGVELHYAVLRADLPTCSRRAGSRVRDEPEARDEFARLHARYAELGAREAHVVDADGTPAAVAHAVLAGLSAGRLRVR